MFILIGYFKGEAFVIGHTTSKRRADRFGADHPHGANEEFDYVEIQHSQNI